WYRLDGREGAPWLVFSNSLGTTHAMWDGQVEALAPRFRILRYDTRGHGQSEVAPAPYSLEQLGRDVLLLADGLGIGRFSFCGLSMGGMTGQWLGAEAADRVERLVLCNTGAVIGNAPLWNERIAQVESRGMAAMVDGAMDRWFTKAFQQSHPAEVRRIRDAFLTIDPRGYARCMGALRDADLRPLLGRIKAPTLVINGSADPATPPALGNEIAAGVKGARAVTLQAAHISNIEAKAAFDEALGGFLAGRD
ncbi:MAG TPA: 3-oxoadipate enol-lactonase, partial [Kiloniellales bacterium]|nr:3-oxoadipate enol-lactonase [Kiloniellales bacterium]